MQNIDTHNPFSLHHLLWLSLLAQWDDTDRPWRVRTLVYWMDEVQQDCLVAVPAEDAKPLWTLYTRLLPGYQQFWFNLEGWSKMSRTTTADVALGSGQAH